MTRGRSRPDGQRPEKHRTSVDSNTLEEQCHPRKIFVGGLAHKTTTQHIREHFGRFGAIVDAVVLRWPDGRSRGFGYVTFTDAVAAASVLQEQHSLSGRQVDVKRAVPGTNKLFVGGLPQNTAANELREHFEKFGVVSDAVVMIDPATGRSRGFGFVCFLPGQEGGVAVASALQQYESHRIRGKWIEVKSAAPPHKLAAQERSAASSRSQDGSNECECEEFSLAGALQDLSRPESLSTENREPNQRAADVQYLGSPRKVALPAGGGARPPLPPGLALAENARMPPEIGGFELAGMPMQLPWWPAHPWPQPFFPGHPAGLGAMPPFTGPASAPLDARGCLGDLAAAAGGTAPPRASPYTGQVGLGASEGLQRNLEEFLRQSMQCKMDGEAGTGTPSVSTACSAATQTEIAAAAALLP